MPLRVASWVGTNGENRIDDMTTRLARIDCRARMGGPFLTRRSRASFQFASAKIVVGGDLFHRQTDAAAAIFQKIKMQIAFVGVCNRMVSKMNNFDQSTVNHWPEPPRRYQAIAILVIVAIVAMLPIIFR